MKLPIFAWRRLLLVLNRTVKWVATQSRPPRLRRVSYEPPEPRQLLAIAQMTLPSEDFCPVEATYLVAADSDGTIHSTGEGEGPDSPVIGNVVIDTTTFDGATSKTVRGSTTFVGDAIVPVDAAGAYIVRMSARSTIGATLHYAGVQPFDLDKNAYDQYYYFRVSGSQDSTLAQPLNPGDTQMVLADASSWYRGASSDSRNFLWFDYRDKTGLSHGLNYSRNVRTNAWAHNGINGNGITLSSPRSGSSLPAGTVVRNTGTAPYQYNVLSNATLPTTLSSRTGVPDGINTVSTNTATKFRPDTEFIRVVIQPNSSDGATPRTTSTWSGVTIEATGTKLAAVENAAAGTKIGKILATDPRGRRLTYSLTDSSSGRFAINSTTGEITVATGAVLNFEATPVLTIGVRLTNSAGHTKDKSYTIKLKDVPEVTTNITGTLNPVPENATSTVTAGQVTAVDPDLNDVITYSLTNSASGKFAINSKNGTITAITPLDYEAAASHTITVRASTYAGTIFDKNFTIQVTDLAEAPVIGNVAIDTTTFGGQGTAATTGATTLQGDLMIPVDRNGSYIVRMTASSDKATTQHQAGFISYDLDQSAINQHHYFQAADGTETTLAQPLRPGDTQMVLADGSKWYEGNSAASRNFIWFDYRDKSGRTHGENYSRNLRTNAWDQNGINGNVATLSSPWPSTSATLPAGTRVRNTVGAAYQYNVLANGTLGSSPVERTGLISGLNSPTSNSSTKFRPATEFIRPVIVASSSGTDAATTTAVWSGVSVEATGTKLAVVENSVGGTKVGKVLASDPFGRSLSYKLVDTAGGKFTIHATTGELSVAKGAVLDHEANSELTITVRVTNSAGNVSDKIYNILVKDRKEKPTNITGTLAAIQENRAAPVTAGQVQVVDQDRFDRHTYSLTRDSEGKFKIDSATGVITTTGPLDFESAKQHQIVVRAKDFAGQSFNKTFTIDVTDVGYTFPNVWLLGENQAIDVRRNADGNVLGDVGYAPGHLGKAFSFDGSSDELRIQDLAKVGTPQASYSLWFKTNSAENTPNLVGRQFGGGRGWSFHLQPSGDVALRVRTSAAADFTQSIPGNFADDQWHFLAATINQTTKQFTLSVDGGATMTLGYTGAFTGGGFFTLGGRVVDTGWYKGLVDDVSVFDRALSEAEFTENYSQMKDIPKTSIARPVQSFLANNPPRVESVTVNDGQAQRSTLHKIVVGFDSLVNVASNAVRLERVHFDSGAATTVGRVGNVQQSISSVNGKTLVTLTFGSSHGSSPLAPDSAGSLRDGNYQVSIDDAGITSESTDMILDGDNDAKSGGDWTSGSQMADKLYRLYGDVDGTVDAIGDVDQWDQSEFAKGANSQRTSAAYRRELDFDGDDDIDAADAFAFNQNLNKTRFTVASAGGTARLEAEGPILPPRVESTVLNSGQAQRSKLTRIDITFDSLVYVSGGAITIQRLTDSETSPTAIGNVSNVQQSIATVNGKTTVTLTFTPTTNPSVLLPDLAGSLKDGNYKLTIDDIGVISQTSGLYLDGDNNSLPFGDRLFGNIPSDKFYRIYGDANGDGFTDFTDFSPFIVALVNQNYIAYFDYDDNNFTDLTDLNRFVNHLATDRFTTDWTPPQILSISPGNNDQVYGFSLPVTVTFHEPVSGVDKTDLVLGGPAAATASVGNPVLVQGNTWRFPITVYTAGTLNLTLAPDANDIIDIAGPSAPTTNWQYNVTLPPPLELPPGHVTGFTSFGTTVLEGASAPVTVQRVWSSSPHNSYAPPVTINYRTIPIGSATAANGERQGGDFITKTGTINFPAFPPWSPLSWEQTIYIVSLFDYEAEPIEDFAVEFDFPDRKSYAIVQIIDRQPCLSQNAEVEVDEGDVVNVQVAIPEIPYGAASAVPETLSATIKTRDWSAEDGWVPIGNNIPGEQYTEASDYDRTTSSIFFSPYTNRSVSFPIQTHSDLQREERESFHVAVDTFWGIWNKPFTIQVFINNKPPAKLSFSNSSISSIGKFAITEGQAPQEITIFLDRPLDEAATITYETIYGYIDQMGYGIATPNDFPSLNGTLKFDKGQTSKSLNINALRDYVIELRESVFITFKTPWHDVVEAVIAIEDEKLPDIFVSSPSVNAGQLATFDVAIAHPVSFDFDVHYQVFSRQDSTFSVQGTWLFPAGTTSNSLSIITNTSGPRRTELYLNVTSPWVDETGIATVTNVSGPIDPSTITLPPAYPTYVFDLWHFYTGQNIYSNNTFEGQITWNGGGFPSFVPDRLPEHGKFKLYTDGRWKYLPREGFVGRDNFTFRVISSSQVLAGRIDISVINSGNDQVEDFFTAPSGGLAFLSQSVLENDQIIGADAVSLSSRLFDRTFDGFGRYCVIADRTYYKQGPQVNANSYPCISDGGEPLKDSVNSFPSGRVQIDFPFVYRDNFQLELGYNATRFVEAAAIQTKKFNQVITSIAFNPDSVADAPVAQKDVYGSAQVPFPLGKAVVLGNVLDNDDFLELPSEVGLAPRDSAGRAIYTRLIGCSPYGHFSFDCVFSLDPNGDLRFDGGGFSGGEFKLTYEIVAVDGRIGYVENVTNRAEITVTIGVPHNAVNDNESTRKFMLSDAWTRSGGSSDSYNGLDKGYRVWNDHNSTTVDFILEGLGVAANDTGRNGQWATTTHPGASMLNNVLFYSAPIGFVDDVEIPYTVNGKTATLLLSVHGAKYVPPTPLDFPPVIRSKPPLIASVETRFNYQLDAYDLEQNGLTYHLEAGPQGMTVDLSSGLLTWLPTSADTGTVPVVVAVRDSANNETRQFFELDVSVPNFSPVTTSPPKEDVHGGQLYIYDVEATDPENHAITYELPFAPSGMTINSQTGLINWAPSISNIGSHLVRVKAVDEGGAFAFQEFKLFVTPFHNIAPEFTSVPMSEAAAGAINRYESTASDSDGDVLKFSIGTITWPAGYTSGESHGFQFQYINSGLDQRGIYTWNPPAELAGKVVQFEELVSDGFHAPTRRTNSVLVIGQPGNSAPVITSEPAVSYQLPPNLSGFANNEKVNPDYLSLKLGDGQQVKVSVSIDPANLGTMSADVILAIDLTGSMNDALDWLSSGGDSVVDQIESSLNKLGVTNNRYGLVVFHTSAQLTDPRFSIAIGNVDPQAPLDESKQVVHQIPLATNESHLWGNVDQLKWALRSASPVYPTDTYELGYHALERIYDPQPDKIGQQAQFAYEFRTGVTPSVVLISDDHVSLYDYNRQQSVTKSLIGNVDDRLDDVVFSTVLTSRLMGNNGLGNDSAFVKKSPGWTIDSDSVNFVPTSKSSSAYALLDAHQYLTFDDAHYKKFEEGNPAREPGLFNWVFKSRITVENLGENFNQSFRVAFGIDPWNGQQLPANRFFVEANVSGTDSWLVGNASGKSYPFALHQGAAWPDLNAGEAFEIELRLVPWSGANGERLDLFIDGEAVASTSFPLYPNTVVNTRFIGVESVGTALSIDRFEVGQFNIDNNFSSKIQPQQPTPYDFAAQPYYDDNLEEQDVYVARRTFANDFGASDGSTLDEKIIGIDLEGSAYKLVPDSKSPGSYNVSVHNNPALMNTPKYEDAQYIDIVRTLNGSTWNLGMLRGTFGSPTERDNVWGAFAQTFSKSLAQKIWKSRVIMQSNNEIVTDYEPRVCLGSTASGISSHWANGKKGIG